MMNFSNRLSSQLAKLKSYLKRKFWLIILAFVLGFSLIKYYEHYNQDLLSSSKIDLSVVDPINDQSIPDLYNIVESKIINGNLIIKINNNHYVYRDSIQLYDQNNHQLLIDLPNHRLLATASHYIKAVFNSFSIDLNYLDLNPNLSYTLHYYTCNINQICNIYSQNHLIYDHANESWQIDESKIVTTPVPQSISYFGNYQPSLGDKYNSSMQPSFNDLLSDPLDVIKYAIAKFGFVGLYFLIGVLLSLTPCSLPNIPFLHKQLMIGAPNSNKLLDLFKGFCATQGLSFTYAIAGVIAVHLGYLYPHAFHNHLVVGLVALLFLYFAFINFGIVTSPIKVKPSNLVYYRILSISPRNIGSLRKGLLYGLLLNPCTIWPIIAVIIDISLKSSYSHSWFELYLIGAGMGIPFLISIFFGPNFFRKFKTIMIHSQFILGVLILGLSLVYLEEILPSIHLNFISVIWVIIFIYVFISKTNIDNLEAVLSGLRVIFVSMVILSSYIVYNIYAKGNYIYNVIYPKEILYSKTNNQYMIDSSKPSLMVFTANWCYKCNSKLSEIYNNPVVRTSLYRFNIIKIDLNNLHNYKIWSNKFNNQQHPYFLILPIKANNFNQAVIIDANNSAMDIAFELTRYIDNYPNLKTNH